MPTSENLKELKTAETATEVIKMPEVQKEEAVIQCSICDLKMTDKDSKLSNRIINYAKDQGGERYSKLVNRVNQAMNLRQIASWKDEP